MKPGQAHFFGGPYHLVAENRGSGSGTKAEVARGDNAGVRFVLAEDVKYAGRGGYAADAERVVNQCRNS